MPDNLVERIKELIYPYQYRAGVFLREDINMVYNPSTHQLSVNPFYQFDFHPKEGSCAELMQTAYEEIREVFPNLWVYRIIGKEPGFFPDGPHCYLLLAERDLLKGKPLAESPQEFFAVVKGNPILVDPSFKRIVRLEKSGYGLVQVLNHGFPLIHPDNQVMEEGEEYPIYYSKGTLVFLNQSRRHPSLLGIGFQRRGEEMRFYDLNSAELTGKINGNSQLAEIVYALRKKEILQTVKPLGYTSVSKLT